MFGIGVSEIIIVFVASFLILGPKRMQNFAYDLGQALQNFKTSWTEFKHTQFEDFDTSSFYDAKTELNKTLDQIKTSKTPSQNQPSQDESYE